MRFDELVTQIETVHLELQSHAVQQVNNALTIRNIVIGYYIVEYEQNGTDRAEYGANTILLLTKRLTHIKGISKAQLYRFREFYLSYPSIFYTVSRILKEFHKWIKSILSAVLKKLMHVKKSIISVTQEAFISSEMKKMEGI